MFKWLMELWKDIQHAETLYGRCSECGTSLDPTVKVHRKGCPNAHS